MPMRRRLHRLLAAVPLVATAGGDAPGRSQPAGGQGDDDELLAEGGELYETGCSSCHGPDGEGVEGPTAACAGRRSSTSGEAAAYYYLSTGRMPLGQQRGAARPQARPPHDEEIDALVAFVGSLGDGPEIPESTSTGADLAAGGEIFRANCQACHSASGSGGALSYGRAAPRLADGDAHGDRLGGAGGPGPDAGVRAGDRVATDELDDLVALRRVPPHAGGPRRHAHRADGPIPEGFVAWLVGMVRAARAGGVDRYP